MSNFKNSLSIGEIGQVLFYQAHNGELRQEDGRKSDFTCLASGHGLELKTDTWSMSSTPNFFFERYSDKVKLSPGGPWQSITHGSNVFVYFYIKNLTYFKFDTLVLIERLNSIIKTLKPVDIFNGGYTTLGYRVKRELVKDIYTEHRLVIGKA